MRFGDLIIFRHSSKTILRSLLHKEIHKNAPCRRISTRCYIYSKKQSCISHAVSSLIFKFISA